MSAPPPPPPPCSKCGGALRASDRFCPSCGTPVGAPVVVAGGGAAASPRPPVDIRQQVDNDRGILKRLQLLIPGFRGYRQGEDLRAADSLLRIQVADRVHRSVALIQDWRTALTNAGQFQALTGLADALADLQKLEGQIRHAEQGYTGISPSVRIRPEQLDGMYEYDYGFIQAADQLAATLTPLASMAPTEPAAATDALARVRGQVKQLDAAFHARRDAVEGILVA